MRARSVDGDEIDDFLELEMGRCPEIMSMLEDKNFDNENLPSFELLLEITREIPELFRFRDIERLKSEYAESVYVITQLLPCKGKISLVRCVRVYDEKYLIDDLKKGRKPFGIYWSLYEVCDFPCDEPFPDDVYVLVTATFDVSCVDVLKTMLAHLAWGVSSENEVRLHPGCVGIIEEVLVKDLSMEAEIARYGDLKGNEVLT